MTQRWRLVSHFLMARWVATSPAIASVNPLSPANGMSLLIERLRPPEGGDLKSAAFWGEGSVAGGLKLV
jgi:hypothetical protein